MTVDPAFKKKRYRAQLFGFALHTLAALLIVAPVVLIVGFLVVKGGPALSWDFLTKPPVDAMTKGGLYPCIAGTFYLMAGTVLLAMPFGILGAIWLAEYAPRSTLTRIVRLCIVNLAGVPSIVYGLFGLGVFCLLFKLGVSLLAGALTLGILILPILITSSEEALLTVPEEFRAASFSLGATKWQTIWRIVLPNALPGILTGSILGLSRAAGETAPILFTVAAYYLPHVPALREVFKANTQVMVLPYHLFIIATQVPDAPEALQWGTALVLLMLVLGVSLVGILYRARLRARRLW
ncbi:MAG: phosphate ABC transporter, permease protein PstA [Armatimonadetes bacterium CG_4_10_14_3_um_filter_66_18]|nr:phosphate ABC transporter permease PstA [Armatimonadota bacterium]OIO96337.1 MAG: phosphate ABC transporter, permease protein PstA [Armatimonadetes bacterium CG2_30_66_41]PIW17269.1 MAG: phosphate ABC transporter, permease protein PstA [Armatimonadetes bacterium CG17_big_fil_post_rev_8_21_14_2_50_66_6]PIX47138.1 MAG: phosphate ABC transporter, permease protein PstA [Armatimonadetes bacterium CG_4_8_14_3_um_filter_66_20]PIY50292.1 MAG: phosphate ABC transporter, permease protein PstA [Armatim